MFCIKTLLLYAQAYWASEAFKLSTLMKICGKHVVRPQLSQRYPGWPSPLNALLVLCGQDNMNILRKQDIWK